MKTLLVTGASGFLGYNFLQLDLSHWKVITLTHQRLFEHETVKSVRCDIADIDLLSETLKKMKPHAVVHLAALSNTNYCEENPELSHKVNVEATVCLAEYCATHNTPFLFSSTDLVFDGTKGNYTETDTVNPLMLYGRQKAMAEKLILDLNKTACILRLPLMFCDGGKNAQSFLQPLLQKLKAGDKVFLFTDEFRSVAGGASVAKGIKLALENNWQGIYHLGGKEKISRYDLGLLICEVFGLDKNLIVPTLQSELKPVATRPPDVSLNSDKAYRLGYEPLLIENELQLLKHLC
jgi:dTDP-4-dehydrorhamnose reductase